VRLGGYALLPRILDKCRGTIAGKNGEYKFNCPLDQEFFEFTQLDAEKFKAEVNSGKGDGEMLAWVRRNARKLTIVEAMAWSAYQDQRAPAQVEKQEFFTSLFKEIAPHRDDISTWFDLLDLDDYVSFGGKA
jgi:hypothetical protein